MVGRRPTIPMARRTLVIAARRTALVAVLRALFPLSGAAVGAAWLADSVPGVLVAGGFALGIAALRRCAVGSIVVGRDGVSLRGLGLERFLPFQRLTAVSCSDAGMDFVMDDGSRLTLELVHSRVPTMAELAQRDELVDAICEEIDAWNLREDVPIAATALDRGSRTFGEWGATLLELRPDADRGYRRARLSTAQLCEVVEDPASPAERRVGAALALSAVSDRRLAARIQLAIDGCASPPLKIALEKAARGELDEVWIERAERG